MDQYLPLSAKKGELYRAFFWRRIPEMFYHPPNSARVDFKKLGTFHKTARNSRTSAKNIRISLSSNIMREVPVAMSEKTEWFRLNCDVSLLVNIHRHCRVHFVVHCERWRMNLHIYCSKKRTQFAWRVRKHNNRVRVGGGGDRAHKPEGEGKRS